MFGLNLQEAIDAPMFHTEHFPSSFYPRAAKPRRVRVESRVDPAVIDELRRRGHDIDVAPDWTEGFVSGAELDEARGVIEAGCDPRGSKSDCFPAFACVW